MKLEVKKIRIKELQSFISSDAYGQMEYVPISPLRAKSYLANPHAAEDDYVLYLGFVDTKLVAFRSLLPDTIYADTKTLRFAWCSGAWVHPNFRRKGYSKQLLSEAYYDWDKKLMFGNYSPNSENLIKQTGWFKPIHQYRGARVYLFPKVQHLLNDINPSAMKRCIYATINWALWICSSVRLSLFNKQARGSIIFRETRLPDDECYTSISTKSLFLQRGEKELRWIFENPWISPAKTETTQNYPFSSFSTSFSYRTIKIYQDQTFLGFFILSLSEGHLKTLYWNIPDNCDQEIVEFLKNFCKKYKVKMLSTCKNELAVKLFKRKFPFLHTKKYGQKIYSTFDCSNKLGLRFQDGDGDVIFT